MLTPDQIRLAIVDCLDAIDETYNRTSSLLNRGTIRGLLWALTGKDHGNIGDATAVCRAAGIPYRDLEDGDYEVDADWYTATTKWHTTTD